MASVSICCMYAGVEQAIKKWEGKQIRAPSARKRLQLPPLFQFAPPIGGGATTAQAPNEEVGASYTLRPEL